MYVYCSIVGSVLDMDDITENLPGTFKVRLLDNIDCMNSDLFPLQHTITHARMHTHAHTHTHTHTAPSEGDISEAIGV